VGARSIACPREVEMPVTLKSIRKTPYRVGNVAFTPAVAGVRPPPPPAVPGALPAGPIKYRNEHTLYPTAAGRVNHTVTAMPNDARSTIGGALSATGDTLFLKYFDDEITSIVLPTPAPAGVVLFVTDNLTGCRFYLDQITAGGTGLVAYHANTHQHSAGAMADADAQTAAASGVLDLMHQRAQADYAALGFTLNNIATCEKSEYYLAAGNEERRKRLQGRTAGKTFQSPAGAVFAGGTTIVGLPSGGSWEFWYQTFGTMDYERPDIRTWDALKGVKLKYLAKRMRHGLDHAAKFDEMKVVDCDQIY
jgi:hypothetical protein